MYDDLCYLVGEVGFEPTTPLYILIQTMPPILEQAMPLIPE